MPERGGSPEARQSVASPAAPKDAVRARELTRRKCAYPQYLRYVACEQALSALSRQVGSSQIMPPGMKFHTNVVNRVPAPRYRPPEVDPRELEQAAKANELLNLRSKNISHIMAQRVVR